MRSKASRCAHLTHDERLRECERLLNDGFGRALDESNIAGFCLVIDGAQSVAEDDALRFCVTGGERDCKSIFTRKPPALGDRADQDETGAEVESPRRQRNYRPTTLLLGTPGPTKEYRRAQARRVSDRLLADRPVIDPIGTGAGFAERVAAAL
jgi:hypothetical protein